MEFEISKSVYCDDLINPPAHDRKCSINLDVANTVLIQFIKENRTNAGTRYLLRLPQAKSTGFTSYEQNIVSHEFDNLILAFNLVLERVCTTSKSSEFAMDSITFKKRLQSSNVRRIGNKVIVDITDGNIDIREDVQVTVIHSAKVEERTILEAFHNLQKLRMFQINGNSSIRENNLKKSLQNYSNAMEEENMVLKFRDLFTALEVCININGIERKDGPFDNEVSNLSGTSPNTVERWRLFL